MALPRSIEEAQDWGVCMCGALPEPMRGVEYRTYTCGTHYFYDFDKYDRTDACRLRLMATENQCRAQAHLFVLRDILLYPPSLRSGSYPNIVNILNYYGAVFGVEA